MLMSLESEQLQSSADAWRVDVGLGGGEQAWSDQS